MNDLDLRDLDAFVAVARTRNFRRAALEQRVSVSSLSQRLRDMEERLGVRLMNRTTRSVALTEAGELLLARVGPAMLDVGDALDQVRGLRGVPSGRLRINAPPPAIDLVLAPMVAPFLRAYPQIDLEIVGDSSFVDIVAQGFDAGVRYGEHLAQDMIAVSLGAAAALCGGGLAATMSRSMAGRSIRRTCSITPASASASAAARMPDWEFEKAGRVVKVSPPAKLIANYPGLARRAALDGVGFWLTFEGYVREDDQIRRAGQRARRLVRAVSRAVSVLSEPAPAAAGARAPSWLCRGMAQAERHGRSDAIRSVQATRDEIQALTACWAARGPAACGCRGRCGC